MSRGRTLLTLALMVVGLLAGLLVLRQRLFPVPSVDSTKLGVAAAGPIGSLRPGERVCQQPVDLDRRATNLGLAMDTAGRPGPALTVSVRRLRDGTVLDRQSVPRGYVLAAPDYYGMALKRPVAGEQSVAVCAQNDGRRPVTLLGREALEYSQAVTDGPQLSGDWAVFFPNRPDAATVSRAENAQEIFRRASVLRPDVVTPAWYWGLFGLLVVGAPLLLWRAVVSASRDEAR